MKKETVDTGQGIIFEITHTTEEDDPVFLSTLLSESLQKQQKCLDQERAYFQQANNERQKANDLQMILFNLKNYNKQKENDIKNGIERVVSRMEPMETYDENTLKQEIEIYKERANEFQKMSIQFKILYEDEIRKTNETQRKLVELNKIYKK